MDDGEGFGRTRFDEDEPNCITSNQEKMDGEKGSAGGVGKEDEADADDEINEAGAEVE